MWVWSGGSLEGISGACVVTGGGSSNRSMRLLLSVVDDSSLLIIASPNCIRRGKEGLSPKVRDISSYGERFSLGMVHTCCYTGPAPSTQALFISLQLEL